MKIYIFTLLTGKGVNTLLEKVNEMCSLNKEEFIFKDNSVEFLVPRKRTHIVRNPELQTVPY